MTSHAGTHRHAGALCPAIRGRVVPIRSLRSHRNSSTDKLVSWFLQLSLLAVWKSLTTLSAPIARVLAVYVWTGKSILKVCSWATRLVLKLTGWLSSPAFPHHNKWIRQWSRHLPWPLDVRKWHLVVAVFVTASVVNSLLRKWRESFDERLRQLRVVQERMAAATSYAEWREFAQQLDRLGHARGGDVTGRIRENLYDRKLLQQKVEHLQSVRDSGNIKEMMFALRTDLIRNIANIAKSQLHEHFYEVPAPIREYIQELKAQLAMLTDWPDGGLDMEEKLSFFRETRHAFGRTALLLSGGGALGSFHLGVVKALFEHRMLPRVLAGSSVGSIVAGLVATRTDDELRDMFRKLENVELSFFNNSRAVELVHSFLQKGALHDMSYLQRKLKGLIGNYTFLEAYERTGRILSVSVCPADTNEPARLLNYLTAPQALIWSAVAASSAFPGLFHPQDLLARNARGEEVRFSTPSMSGNIARRWRDGSLELDLPTFLLSEMFNCNHFIVSQTNPHIVPLLNLKKGLSRRWANLLELELRHRCAQFKWIMPDWFPTQWISLFTQPWEGDITLVLPSHLWNLGKSIVNPTTTDILNATRQGELAIWEKLSAIETNCTIEATLDACLARLTNKARERPLGGLSSRIPSWLSMSTIGQQAVASWGNPLEAGASPGHRPWGSYPKGAGMLSGPSWGHLPAVVHAQQMAAAAAAAAATVRKTGSSGGLAPGLAIGPSGCVAAVLAAEQQQQQLGSHYGSDLPMSPTGSSVSSHGSSSSGPSTNLEDGPATLDEAMAAMANAANLGGVHSGYSYTATALHHAHAQQHGNSPKHLQQPPPQQQQPQGGTMGAGQLPGGLSVAFARHSSSGGCSSSSPAAAAGSGGSTSLFMSAGSVGSGGLVVPPTIHENLPDEKPGRVASWGTNDIADSVSDFPANGSSGSNAATAAAAAAAAAANANAAAAAVAAAYHARRASGAASPGRGLLVRLLDSKGLLDETADGLPAIPSGAGSSSGSNASAAAAAAAARVEAAGGDSRRSSLSSTEAHAPSEVLGQLDCCDASAAWDIWSSLLPLATSALALEAAATEGPQGLDCIAP